ncbi:MAG: glycosyltransferase [Vicinamibacterales bacterium]|nr:glycosyltransferase [Vicinamibacterales bacterium]
MRATLIAIGPRGDIQPMIALGAGLRAAGLDVRCATHEDFADLARAHGLDVALVQGRADRFFGGAAGIAVRERLADARTFRRFFDDYLSLFYAKLLDEITGACADADLLVCWPWMRFAPSLADRFGVPVVIACPYPPMHLPTSAFPNPFLGVPDPGVPARRTWRHALPVLQAGEAALDRWRRAQGLPSIGWRADVRRLRRLPHLLGFSPAVLPRPIDWPDNVTVTGFWFLDERADYAPPEALRAFLEEGAPPVAIGFSSQLARDSAALQEVVDEGVARAGVRAVLLTGFSGLAGASPGGRVFPIASVPHDWLYPRVAAVAHHGGSGSTGAALRAGVPNFAVPFGYDQPLWGHRLQALGVGPAPIPVAALTAERLAEALTTLTTDPAMRARAAQVGAVVRAEDGVGDAVRALLRMVEG